MSTEHVKKYQVVALEDADVSGGLEPIALYSADGAPFTGGGGGGSFDISAIPDDKLLSWATGDFSIDKDGAMVWGDPTLESSILLRPTDGGNLELTRSTPPEGFDTYNRTAFPAIEFTPNRPDDYAKGMTLGWNADVERLVVRPLVEEGLPRGRYAGISLLDADDASDGFGNNGSLDLWYNWEYGGGGLDVDSDGPTYGSYGGGGWTVGNPSGFPDTRQFLSGSTTGIRVTNHQNDSIVEAIDWSKVDFPVNFDAMSNPAFKIKRDGEIEWTDSKAPLDSYKGLRLSSREAGAYGVNDLYLQSTAVSRFGDDIGYGYGAGFTVGSSEIDSNGYLSGAYASLMDMGDSGSDGEGIGIWGESDGGYVHLEMTPQLTLYTTPSFPNDYSVFRIHGYNAARTVGANPPSEMFITERGLIGWSNQMFDYISGNFVGGYVQIQPSTDWKHLDMPISGSGLRLTSPDGTKHKVITLDNSGNLALI